MAGVEYQVTKVDPTDPETKGMVYQVHKVTEEVAATMGGKIYRARVIKNPSESTVVGKVYQIVLIGDPDDTSVKGKVYNAILTGDSEATVVGPGTSPLSLENAEAADIVSLKAFGGTEQNGTPTPDVPINIVCNNGALKARRPSGLPLDYQQIEWLKSTQMIELDKPTKDTYELQSSIYREDLTTQYIYQSDTTSSGTTNTTAYLSATVGNWRFDGQTKTVYVPELEQVITKQNKNGIWLNDTQIDTYTNVNSFTSTNNLRLFGTQSTPTTRLHWFKMLENETLVYDIIPVRKISTNELGVYDKVSGQFFTNSNATLTAGNDISDPIEVYADGTQETIAIKDDQNATVSTAVAEMLLSIDDYTDVQSIIDGVVTRKIGVIVLDGTETWSYLTSSSYERFSYVLPNLSVNANIKKILLCNYYESFSASSVYSGKPTYSCWIEDGKNLRFHNNDYTTAASWKAYLSAQFAAGTPVIVIYPLETPTTESVAGQTLQVTDGDNTLEITQASMTGLELEVTYIKEAE